MSQEVLHPNFFSHRHLLSCLGGLALCFAFGCGSGGTTTGSGGSTASGGTTGSGGTVGSGGSVGTGGATVTGGTVGTGGKSSSGGATGTGGTGGSGGKSGAGGTTDTGGKSGSGGTMSAGGAEAMGGTTGFGGTSGASGGATGDGGPGRDGSATGGSSGTGGSGAGGSTVNSSDGGTTAGATGSTGCGKTPSTLKNSPSNTTFTQNTISVSGTSRQFIIRWPDDYKNTTPYRLIIGLHGAGGKGADVAGPTSKEGPYFGLWDLSKGTTIFVAPSAGGSQHYWDATSDTAFVKAILDLVEGELCIDTSRIMLEGFSQGAAMSWTLACGLEGVFRAVAGHSGGGVTPPSKCQPIAYFGSRGTREKSVTQTTQV